MAYSKIHSCVVEDEKAASLLLEHPLAEACRLWSLTVADVYGILPGHPCLYRAKVCPLVPLSDKKIRNVIDTLVERGFYRRYEVEGKTYLYVTNYHKYQSVEWWKFSVPKYPLPPDWSIPASLQRFFEKSPEHRLTVWFMAYRPNLDRTSTEPRPRIDPISTQCRLNRRTDVQTTDVQTRDIHMRPEGESEGGTPQLPESSLVEQPTALFDAVEVPVLSDSDNGKRPRPPVPAEVLEQRKADLISSFPEATWDGLDNYLANAAADSKSGATTLAGDVSRLRNLKVVLDEIGPEAFAHGLGIANEKGAANPNYVKTAGRNMGTKARASPGWLPASRESAPIGVDKWHERQ